MKKEVLEGEIIEDHVRITRRQAKSNDVGANPIKFPALKLLLSLVPIIGLGLSVGWFYYEKSKKLPTIVFSIFGIVFGIFSTCTFLVLKFIIKAIF